ncbi:site-specific integrase [Chitinophaga japonensis]|uniref:Site-specific recombinase XerD n=1 Tax=Chitinophaga japonensis TaxID=104662 RepID=A0A562T245_CHIJA|nr:site-specific integrase [Chitinophaga japonensis]TWI87757.1 site-specific recombinase XerD [Chitinophaga japonensis]
MKVKLRRKPISKGRMSLYLDIYPPVPHPATGKITRYQFLELFIYKRPQNELEKRHNKETLELATHITANKQLDVQNKRYAYIPDSMLDKNFIDFFESLRDERKESNHEVWKNAIMYFKDFTGEFLSFRQINETFCEEYADYLKKRPALGNYKKPISRNTAVSYFRKFKFALKQAFKKKYLYENIGEIIDGIKELETFREFLFQDELQNLADTSCVDDVRRASLVSALTGLRYSDVSTLYWSEIRGGPGNYYIQFRQEKTRAAEHLPVADVVIELLGEPGEWEERVFSDLNYSRVRYCLDDWVKRAGIKKHITFHCFRHTFATLQLAAGTDILTVSKMLGHKRLETTLIYVKIVDKLKKDAAQRVRLDITKLKINMAA